MTLTAIHLKNFTAFHDLNVKFSPGINVFVGANGTGKTHLMKVAYAACDITKSQQGFAAKLINIFLPSGRALGRLVRRQGKSSECSVSVSRKPVGDHARSGARATAKVSFSNHAKGADSAKFRGEAFLQQGSIESVYIPVKEMLSNGPGFRSLYSQRDIHFEEVYSDILVRAYRPPLRGPADKRRKKLLELLQEAIDGKVTVKKEEFFLRNKQGNLEFSLLAEGLRKLGLLWLLIQNGTLLQGSVLFWDEPETNLNPKMFGVLMEILLELQREGVQVFLATHDYVILKELDLRKQKGDNVAFHSLYHPSNGEQGVACHTATSYLDIHPNAIAEAFTQLYDREVERSLGGGEK